MPAVLACPTARDYERLRGGEMSLSEVEQLALHLEKCGRCVEKVQGLSIDDTLIESLRAQSTVTDPAEKNRLADLMVQLKQLCVASKVEETAADLPSPPGIAIERTQEIYEFLSPAQGPVELGRLGPYRVLKVNGTGGMVFF
jgi:hypothetical protein